MPVAADAITPNASSISLSLLFFHRLPNLSMVVAKSDTRSGTPPGRGVQEPLARCSAGPAVSASVLSHTRSSEEMREASVLRHASAPQVHWKCVAGGRRKGRWAAMQLHRRDQPEDAAPREADAAAGPSYTTTNVVFPPTTR